MPKENERLPQGWRQLQYVEVFINEDNSKIIIQGEPCECGEHNCDEMGCGSFDHTLIMASVTKNGL